MIRYLRSLFAMIMLCLLPGLSAARIQQDTQGDPPSPQRGQDTVKTEGISPNHPTQGNVGEGGTVLTLRTEVVTLNVTVTDKHDNLMVAGLEPQHFEVYEDNVMQKIEFFSNVEAPVSIGIVFDISLSMKGKLDRAREALKAFIETSHRDDDFFLIPFDHRPHVIAESTDGETAVRLLSEVDAGGATALYDAAYLGIEEVKRGRHKKQALLIISDGEDNSSHYSYEELRRLLKESDVQVY